MIAEKLSASSDLDTARGKGANRRGRGEGKKMQGEIKLDHGSDYLRLYIYNGQVKIAVGNNHVQAEMVFTPNQIECYNLGHKLISLGINLQDAPCPDFSSAAKYFPNEIRLNIRQDCETNGHYLCGYCVFKKPQEENK